MTTQVFSAFDVPEATLATCRDDDDAYNDLPVLVSSKLSGLWAKAEAAPLVGLYGAVLVLLSRDVADPKPLLRSCLQAFCSRAADEAPTTERENAGRQAATLKILVSRVGIQRVSRV
jgi:hypothetical protein